MIGVIELPPAADAVACGPVWVSPDEMCEVRLKGKPVKMSLTHQKMLAILLRAQGRVVARKDLYEQATSRRAGVRSRSVDVQIFRIRRALGTYGEYLLSVPGRGYRIDVVGLSKAR